MGIGTAIFASVVLVLVVYNSKFRRIVGWIVGIGGALGVLIVGVEFLKERHDASVFKRTVVQECIKRLNTTGIPPTGSATINDACEAYGGWEPQDKLNGFVYDAKLVAADRERQKIVWDPEQVPKGSAKNVPKCNHQRSNRPCTYPEGEWDYVLPKDSDPYAPFQK